MNNNFFQNVFFSLIQEKARIYKNWVVMGKQSLFQRKKKECVQHKGMSFDVLDVLWSRHFSWHILKDFLKIKQHVSMETEKQYLVKLTEIITQVWQFTNSWQIDWVETMKCIHLKNHLLPSKVSQKNKYCLLAHTCEI